MFTAKHRLNYFHTIGYKPMSNINQETTSSSKEYNKWSSKEDKIIKSTLVLLNDNKHKLRLVEELNECAVMIKGNNMQSSSLIYVVGKINSVSADIKKSHDAHKHHLNQVNPNAKLIAEAYERMERNRALEKTDAANILLGYLQP